MFTIITANALLVWFVWGFFMASAGCLVLGSWNGCSGWCGAGGLQQDANFENARPSLVVTRTGRLSSQGNLQVVRWVKSQRTRTRCSTRFTTGCRRCLLRKITSRGWKGRCELFNPAAENER